MLLKIPGVMRAVSLGADGKLQVTSKPVPKPRKGEVLIKMNAAPINPSDFARIRHVVETGEQSDFIPGIEGSGQVIASGGGILPYLWLNKRVSCTCTHHSSGTWAEYMVTRATNCIPLSSVVSDEQGSMMLVNPMTAVAFMKIAAQGRHKAFINTAAASSLGRMIDILARENNLTQIHIVRNERQQRELLNRGALYVLDSSGSNFKSQLLKLSRDLQATLLFDAVGGSLTRQIMLVMPYGSTIIVYGNLSGEQPEVDHRSLVSDNKKVQGFYLANWLKEEGLLGMLRCIRGAGNLLKHELTILVRARYALQDIEEARVSYLENMTAGKVILLPGS
jgi:NADPH:quinone reductase-like Zn-dependent oxidoreductase